jgi:hypothetical protein
MTLPSRKYRLCVGLTIDGLKCKKRVSWGCEPYCSVHWCKLRGARGR